MVQNNKRCPTVLYVSCRLGLLMVVAVSGQPAPSRADVTTGGLLVELSGDSSFSIEYVEQSLDFLDEPRQWFFFQDHSLYFSASGSNDDGVDYGVELELTRGVDSNADWGDLWTFIEGRWGEVRVGNDDAPAENMAIGGSFPAFGTGGIDGDLFIAPNAFIEDGGDATKIIYYTSDWIPGLLGGLSYALNADDVGSAVGGVDAVSNIVNVAGVYEAALGQVDIGVFAAMVPASSPDAGLVVNYAVGGSIWWRGVEIAGYIGDEDPTFAGDDLDGERRQSLYNLGIGTEILGNIGISFSYQKDSFEETDYDTRTWIGGVTVPLLPGVWLDADLGYQKQDLGETSGAQGFNGISQLYLAF